MDKYQISEYLKTILLSAKLPDRIYFETSEDCLFIKLCGRGVVANMQTDESAFEGWAIVLKSALPGINKVCLDWERPVFNSSKQNAQQAHYRRFLMRVANFKQAYSWFSISKEQVAEVNNIQALIESNTIAVNFPKKEYSTSLTLTTVTIGSGIRPSPM